MSVYQGNGLYIFSFCCVHIWFYARVVMAWLNEFITVYFLYEIFGAAFLLLPI